MVLCARSGGRSVQSSGRMRVYKKHYEVEMKQVFLLHVRLLMTRPHAIDPNQPPEIENHLSLMRCCWYVIFW